MDRRSFLIGAAGVNVIGAAALDLRNSSTKVVPATAGLEVNRTWSGSYCRSQLRNRGAEPVAVNEVTLFSIPHSMAAETKLYGESFQMLSQTGGTLGKPIDY